MKKKLLISCSSLRSNLNVTPKSIHLSIEVCDSVGSSKLQWRGRSCAAAAAACAPSETSDTCRKRGQRVPKHERRAMVESFVNKYQSENAGKLPAIKHTQKEVGGSYYVIREIIQELEYKSKMKPLNNIGEIPVAKLFDESKLKTTESVSFSSGDIKSVKDAPIQNRVQSAIIHDTLAREFLEGKGGPQISSWEARLCNEVEVISTPDDDCTTSDSNISEKHFKDFSSPQMPNDVKTEESVSSFSDSVALESHSLQLEAEHFSRGHESEFVDMKNHKKMEEQSIRKLSYERREQPALEDMYGEASHSSPQVPNDVKSDETVSSCPSDYVAPTRHQLKEEIEQVSAPIIEKSGRSSNKDQIHDSKFGDIKKHPTNEIKSLEKAGLERKVQDGAKDNLGSDSPNIDSSNKRESNSAVASDKSNLWGNLKSFADGILNIWRKL